VRRDGHGVRSEQGAPGGDDGIVGPQIPQVGLEEGQGGKQRGTVLHDAGKVGPQVRELLEHNVHVRQQCR